jgi:hypothetical protein
MEVIKYDGDLLNASKGEIVGTAQDHANELIESGEHDPLDLLVRARKALAYLETFTKAMDSEARTEMQKYHNKTIVHGAMLQMSSTGDRLDYDQDPTYLLLKRKLKERADMLKQAANNIDALVVDDDGCPVPVVPLKSASRETLKVLI